MDTALLIITIVSLAAALASIVAVRRLKRSDQQRSDARVAALAAAAESPATPATRAIDEGLWKQAAGEWKWNAEPEGIRDSGFGNESPIPSSDLFGTVQREAPASNRFVLVAAAALIVALGGAVVVYTTSGHDKTGTHVVQAAHPEPLELVSLGHSRDASMLTINGVVRNPVSGPKLERLTAVVSLIDRNGGLISTKDVPLDYRALGPGEEAPFKVTVPDPGSVARYRVSFRAGTDVVPHVDRRGDTKRASAL